MRVYYLRHDYRRHSYGLTLLGLSICEDLKFAHCHEFVFQYNIHRFLMSLDYISVFRPEKMML
jgi:hypothetical protein